MRALFAIFRAQLVVFFRNPVDFFVTAALPLVLLVIFGFIWISPEEPTKVGLVVGGQKELFLSVLSEFPALSWKEFPKREDLEEAVAKKSVDFGLVWDGKSLTVLLDQSRMQENPTFELLSRRIARALELRLAQLSPPVEAQKIHVGKLAASWYHYVVPGLMVMAILQAGVFATAGTLSWMRETGVLRRILATPLTGWTLASGVGLLRLSIGFAIASMNFLVAQVLFKTTFSADPGLVIFFLLSAGLGGLGLGALVSIGARKPGTATILGSILVQVMLFISGIYIPFEFLPPGLKVLGRILPAYYLAQGMRGALGVMEKDPVTFLAGLSFALFGLAIFFLFGRLTLRPE